VNPGAKLSKAQFEIAYRCGFSSWRALKKNSAVLERLLRMPAIGAMISAQLKTPRRPTPANLAVTMMTRLAALPLKHPSAALLLVQILSILLYPLMQDTPVERAFFRVIGLLVLGTALYVVKRGPWLARFAVMLALPVVVLSIWLAFDFDLRGQAIVASLAAMFYFYATGSLIAYMLEDEFASADELFAAGATFTLLAWAFAYVYLVCQALLPVSFGAMAVSGSPRTWMELLFLSFTTLSGVGLGDILPVLPMARALVMIEEFTGVMYLALVVSRLIALSVMTRTPR
jgi:hypothetical protein